MADNTELNSGSGGDTIATDDIAGVKHQRVKIQYGVDGSATDVSDTNPLPIDDAGGSITIDGTVTANLSATDNAVLDQIEVNTSYGDQTGGGVESSALRVTIANDSTGVVSVDDNGATLSVDDGGGALTVDGTVTANLSATDNAVLDQIEVNTSYGDNTGGGTETGALRVTIANNSTGVLSVDDNGSTLSIDDGAGSLTIDNTDITTIAGAVSGTEMQVDVVASLPAGTNNIGDVDVLSQPARAATTDNLGAALMTNVIHNGTTALTPKFAAIDAALSGDNTLVAAVAAKKIRVLSLMMVSAGTVTTRFEDGASGTALSGQMNLVANSGFTLPFNPVGWFETTANTLLNLELSGAVSVDGMLVYVEV